MRSEWDLPAGGTGETLLGLTARYRRETLGSCVSAWAVGLWEP